MTGTTARRMGGLALLAAVAACGAGSAGEAAPQPRPVMAEPAPAGADALPEVVPVPKARPQPPDPPARAPEARLDPAPPPLDANQEIACRWRLKALGVAYEDMQPIKDAGGCGAAAPIRVSELGGGIGLSPPATLNCRMAEALARWVQEAVVPAAERHLDAAPTGLVNAASYVCRSRNNLPGARLSEHATANAIDIAGFTFAEDEAVPVVARSDEEARERAFQRVVRQGACEHFTTVLGPGTDAAHATHFHLDLAQRRSGYRLCQ